MASRLYIGLVAAVLGAACYGAAPAVQAVAARQQPPGGGAGLALTVRLARRPLWLLGLGGEVLGFVLEAFALARAPTTLVAPVMAADLIVFVGLASMLVGERLAPRGAAGIAVMVGGIALLAIAFAGRSGLGRPADDAQLWTFLGLAVLVVGAAALAGNRALARGRASLAAGAFSLAAGSAYGLATMTTRQVGRTFSAHAPLHLLATPTPYVLGGCSVLAITMLQRALQAGPLLGYPVTSVVSSIVPVVLGAALLDDPVPVGAARVGFVAALGLVVAGVVLLGAERARAE